MQEAEVFAFFERQYRKPLAALEWLGLFYFPLAGPVLMGAICYSYNSYNRFSNFLLSTPVFLFALLHVLLGILFFQNLSQVRRSARHMTATLKNHRDDLAWIYIETIRTYFPYPTPPNLYYHFTNRQVGRISGSLAALNQVVDFLAARYPQMSIGYRPGLAFRYWNSPKRLKEHPERHRYQKETVITSVDTAG